MPDKRNESKIKTMLERGGLIRKTGPDDGAYDSESGNSAMQNESDIKPLFEVPDNPVKVTPAARQPIPGMPNPVFPVTKDTDFDSVYTPDVQEPERALASEVTETEKYTYEDVYKIVEAPEPVVPAPAPAPVPAVQSAPVPQQKSSPVFSGLNIFRNGNGNGNTSASTPATPAVQVRDQQPETYTDRFLNTEELYDALALRSKKTETIYLIEEYLQTLPDSLPDTSRREIVSKLIAASGFDYDLLMGDGVLRVKMLKEYAERFARHTDDYIAARQAELDELDQQILRIRRLVETRKDLHKKQFFSIEAEAQRLKEILTFISG